MDRSESDHLPYDTRQVLRNDVCNQSDGKIAQQTGQVDASLTEVASALKHIGDQLADQYDLNQLVK